MAGEKIPEIYCWDMYTEGLKIYLASTRKGALRVGVRLNGGTDCVSYFKEIYPKERVIKDEYPNRTLIGALEAALENKPAPEKLATSITGTTFQRRAWEAITRIPFGQTLTYGEVAGMVGCTGGARAIGQAMNRNPLPIIYP